MEAGERPSVVVLTSEEAAAVEQRLAEAVAGGGGGGAGVSNVQVGERDGGTVGKID